MLRRALLAAALVAFAALAQPEDRAEGVKSPTRLTVGLADALLGQLTPDAGRLYFVSTARTASEIAYQEPPGGRIRTFFDESADVTWPTVSPDGKRLAYVSLGEHATGQLCVRELPEGTVRRCLESPVGALQAEWMSATRLGLVVRDSIQGDLRLVRVELQAGQLVASPLPQRNLVSPAFSADGRWLVYVPIARYSQEVGPGFAASASPRLEAVRLDQPGVGVPFSVDAPGVTAQPVFSPDGQWLYFVQFSHDSDHDGKVDALDHGELFRVRFPTAADDAPLQAQAAVPEQLTDGTWNCQYPRPTGAVLVASCSQKDNVDVHELPLDGLVPRAWSPDRLKEEAELVSQTETQLLLYHRVLESEPSLSSRHRAMVRMVRMHLELEDFVAAHYYARRVGELEDGATAGVTRPLQALVELREGQLQREHGRVVSGYGPLVAHALALLAPVPGESKAARTLSRVVESEALQLQSDLPGSRRALEAAEVDQQTPRAVLELYHDRADLLYRLLDDEAGLQAACRKLLGASRKPEVQLEYALALGRSLLRGLPYAQKVEKLEKALAEAKEGSELRFALELQRALVAIRASQAPGAIEGLRALTHAQQRADRKRAILIAATERAADFEAEELLELLAEDAVVDFPVGSADRARVEQLFSRVVMSRAYVHRARGEYAEALDDFKQVARQTRSLEALVGELDLRLKDKASAATVTAELEKDASLPPYLRLAGQAWVLERGLGELEKKAQEASRKQALALLRQAWPNVKQSRLGQALFGALKHEEFLATADPAAAEQANAHYLTGLRLSKGSPRQTAMLLGQLGLLQLSVGNYRLALAQLDAREKFPYLDNGAGVALELARARALLHVGREKEAVETVEEAVVMTGRNKKLGLWEVLTLDRAALTNLAAGQHARALTLYDRLLPLLTGRNELVARLARAAAALGAGQAQRALQDLEVFDALLLKPEVLAELQLPHQTPAHALRAYRLISAGLRANANARLELLEPTTAALTKQRALQLEELTETDRDDDLKGLLLVEARLADLTAAQGLSEVSLSWATQALAHADQLLTRTGAPLGQEQADALWLWSTLYTRRGQPLPAALAARLHQTLGQMSTTADPLWRIYERWFEVYLALDAVDALPAAAR